MRRQIWWVLAVAMCVSFAVDYGTRLAAQRSLPIACMSRDVGTFDELITGRCQGMAVPVVPSIVDLRLSVNAGSAFGFFSGRNTQRVFSAVWMVLVTLMVVDAFRRMQRSDYRKARVVGALGVVAGTALADFVERLVNGYVTDFVLLRYKTTELPVFNLGGAAGKVAILYMLVVLAVAQTQRPHWTRHLSSFRNAQALAGTSLRLISVLLFFIGVGLVVEFIVLFAGAISGIRAPVGVELIAGGAVVLVTAVSLQSLGRRLQQPRMSEVEAVDPRGPVLLLRSFRKERARLPRRSFWALFAIWRPDYLYASGRWTFERALTSILDHHGPLIALGSDQDVLQPLGASRSYVSTDAWKSSFDELRARASLVVMIPDDTHSIRYELEVLARDGQLAKLVLIVPPERAVWASLQRDLEFFPEIHTDTIAVRFDPNGAPIVIDADVRLASPWRRLDALEAEFGQSSR